MKPEPQNDIAERLARLSPEQRALLELRLKKHRASESSEKRLSRRAAGTSAPLSFAQQRMWFLSQLAPDSSGYNQPKALRLNGALDLEALQKALNGLVERHEVLRTIIATVAGNSVQVVRDPQHVNLTLIDLGGWPESQRDSEAQRLLRELTHRPFDLTRDLMLRAAVLRLSETNHILLLVTHHIASDGWSRGIVWREITELYRAFTTGERAALEDLPLQYADYAIWQREWLQGEVLASQLAYWKKKLADIPALQLPTDRPRPPIQSYRGESQFIVLPEDLSTRLKALSRQEGTTLFMTLLAAFQILLYRWTGQDDIVVGSPIANRNQLEVEALIGFFVNTLVLRTDITGEATFRGFLGRVREMALEAYAHQDLPFEKLVEELKPERDLSRQPLFQVMFQLRNDPNEALALQGINIEPLEFESGVAKFDLSLSMTGDESGRLSGSLEYNTDLFDYATIERMLGHFHELLTGIVADPGQQIAELPLLTNAERRQLLVEWNFSEKDYPRDKCIHALFEEQVERTPDAVAVVFDSQQLTYRELNQRANRLARYLRRLGVGAEILVGICMDRSLDLVVALLAVLKSGGAYVPLDPEYPKQRLAFMLEDTQAKVVLTQERLIVALPESRARLVCLDRDRHDIVEESGENPISETTAENLAYVIYTSGSTGAPKGVEIPHRGVLRLLFGVEYAELGVNKTFLQLAPTSFDASTFEIWGALLHGAKCVLFPGNISDPSEIGDILHHHKITTLWLTASLFNTVIDEAPEALSDVHQLLIGGEALSVPHVRRALAVIPTTQIINGYGPTESTTFTCCYAIPARVDESISSIPIGRPIANTEVYLLDSHGSPVPVGVAGELYIGGDGLARGYLGNAELTAEKFVPHPFAKQPGARLYKTGDLARYLPGGHIEFLGRIDHQIKIRGFRIEPGEIESVLSQHATLREAVVLAREDNPGDKRLVAYVVARSGPAPSANELRAFLKAKLPDYMLPSALVFLDSLPLGANGKLDRKRLPAPDRSGREFEQGFVAPRTPMEEMIANIWAEVLKLEKIGVHDNFFEAGGHSLLATRAVSRLGQAFQMELSLRVLFEKPTVSALAEHIEESRHNQRGVDRLSLFAVSREKQIPLSFAQQRLWFLDQLEPGGTAYNLSGAFRLRGSLVVAALEQSVNEIIRRHESLRTTFATVEGKPVQVIAPSLTVPLFVIDLSQNPESDREEEARRLLGEEARRPFDLARGPLVRATLLRLGERDHELLLTMHHIVSDGWSMGVLYRELAVLYRAFSRGESTALSDLSRQYADFTLWQRAWLQGKVLASQVSYWKKQLEGIPAVLSLPTDRPRRAAQSSAAARQSLELSNELTEGLKQLSRKEGATLFMTLLAAFQTLLYRYTGQEDIVVGSPIANRNQPDSEELIGFFVNTLVLRSNFSGNPTFKELLAQVKAVALDAYAHQDLPFERLVEELRPERTLNHTPLFQVLFNMVNQEHAKLELFGLAVERMVVASDESKFDATLYVRQQDNEISFDLVYRADLFDAARMRWFLQQYRYLLEQMVAAPQEPIRSYSLVTVESRPVLPDPSATLGAPPQQLVTTTFLSLAKQTPAAPAINQGQQTWNYDELAQRADTLARVLLASGSAPREVIAVYGAASFGLVAAMIATLLSGGILLPVDCTLPMQRKQRMLREGKAKKVLYVGARQPEDTWLEEDFAADILFIDAQKGCALDRQTLTDVHSIKLPVVDSDDPAYIFFTSGSTGVPKGVLGCHKGLSHFLAWQRETFAIGAGDRTAQLTALSFDAVLRDIFLPLTSGATLCLPEVNDLASGEIIPWLERQRISVLHAVPSLAQSWLACGDAKVHLQCMRWVFFVGEPLTEAFVRQWRAAFANTAEIVNLYGPTETTLVKCFYRVPADIGPGVQPVGRPIAHTQALVFNGSNQLCGINEPGEIVLRTPFRSLGYINAPEETHKRFVKNPFGDDPQDLIYCTGDAGCYQPDGTLQILGRLDDQFKIRGVRIEPAEVAATLARHPLVESCVVVGKQNEETYLAAYVVLSREEKSTTAELRSYLLEQLPPAMVPSVFVLLDALPLTANGKIDRQALPEPDRQRAVPEASYIAPRTEVERVVADVWAEVLKLQRVGVSDNFFELGGHSLLATQIVSRIRQRLLVDLPLRVLFEKPTVAGLSEQLERIQRSGKEDPLTATNDVDGTEEVTL